MANDNKPITVSDWVDDRLANLTVSSLTDVDAPCALSAFHKIRSRKIRQLRIRIWVGISALVLPLVLITIPTTRAFAQRLWNKLFLTGNTIVIRTSQFEPPPSDAGNLQSDNTEEVASAEEASARIGFVPHLPRPEVVDGFAPALRILHFKGNELTIHTSEIAAGLQRAGVSPADVEIPANWDGVVIRFPEGRGVFARYGTNTHWVWLGQAKLQGILVPDGFAADKWVEVMLRTLGLSAAQAREQRNRFAANPFGFILVPPDYKGTVREVALRSGSAILIENDGDDRRCLNCPEIGNIAIQWNTADRSYRMLAAGVPQDRVIEIANSIE